MGALEIIRLVIIGVGILGVFALFIFAGISSDKNKGIEQKDLEEHLEQEPEYTETRARLVAMHCSSDVIRIYHKVPKTVKTFCITFKLEDGGSAEFEVEEEIYLLLEEGMTGTLVTVEGNFYGFEADN
jgi:hypothetical protein